MPHNDEVRSPSGAHVGEGELHTFLDGAVEVLDASRAREVRAHLNGCATCRDRLAVAAAVRDRATELLRGDDPLQGLVLPTLVELQARAGSPAPGTGPAGGLAGGPSVAGSRSGGGGSRRGPVLAWAATVALSLGIGYGVGVLGPAGLRPGAVPRPEAARSPAEGVATPAPLEDAVMQPAEAEEPGEAPPASPSPQPEAPAAAAGPLVGEAPDEEAPVSSGEPDPAAAPSAGPLERLRQAPERAEPIEVTAQPRGDAQGGTRPAAVVDRAGAGADAVLPRVVIGATEAARPSPLFRNAAVPAPALPVPSAAPMRSAEADRGAGDGLVLPGFTIDEVRWTEVWPGQEGVVVRQRLAGGPLLELRVAGAAVGTADPVRPPPDGAEVETWARAVREVEGGWTALDGPLPGARLAELLASLR